MMKKIYYLLLTFAITSFAFGQTACDGATALTIGTQQCGNTNDFGDLFDDSECLGNYDGGDDYIFSYTATTTGDKLDLTITGQLSWTGFAMSQGCPEGGAGTCVGVQTSSGSGALNFESDALIAGEVYYIQISTYPSPQSTDFCLDAVLVPVPSCLAPTSLAVSDITTTTASVSWTANSSEMAWEYQVVAGGAMPAETGTATSENPLALTALTANTTYDVYVRANCGAGDTSVWVGPLNFTTPCEAYSIPYFEGFEAGYTHASTVGGCLSQESISGWEHGWPITPQHLTIELLEQEIGMLTLVTAMKIGYLSVLI